MASVDQPSMFSFRFDIYLWVAVTGGGPGRRTPRFLLQPTSFSFISSGIQTPVSSPHFSNSLAKSHLFCGLCPPRFTSNSLVSFGISFFSEVSPLKPPPSMFHIPIRLLHQCSLLPRNPGRNGGSGSSGCVIISY